MSTVSKVIRIVASIIMGILTISVLYVGDIISGELLLLVTLFISPFGVWFCEKHKIKAPGFLATAGISIAVFVLAAVCTSSNLFVIPEKTNATITDEGVAASSGEDVVTTSSPSAPSAKTIDKK